MKKEQPREMGHYANCGKCKKEILTDGAKLSEMVYQVPGKAPLCMKCAPVVGSFKSAIESLKTLKKILEKL